jgi:hypothetical protein
VAASSFWCCARSERRRACSPKCCAKLRQSLSGEQDACTLTPVLVLAGHVVGPRRPLCDGHAIGGTLTSRRCSTAEPRTQGGVSCLLVPSVVVRGARCPYSCEATSNTLEAGTYGEMEMLPLLRSVAPQCPYLAVTTQVATPGR